MIEEILRQRMELIKSNGTPRKVIFNSLSTFKNLLDIPGIGRGLLDVKSDGFKIYGLEIDIDKKQRNQILVTE